MGEPDAEQIARALQDAMRTRLALEMVANFLEPFDSTAASYQRALTATVQDLIDAGHIL